MRKRQPNLLLAAPADAPMSELNTTPLIDVMLVLLIMFIITIPITTHKVPLDLPQPGPERTEPVVHRLELAADGRITLDGAAIAGPVLSARLAAIAAEQNSDLALHAHGEARYEHFDELMAQVKRAGITRLGMVGNERFAESLR